VEGIKQAFVKAGVEICTSGEISEDIQNAVSAQLLTVKEYVGRLNKMFRGVIDQNKKKQ
jgi:hypothetical protein